MPLEDNILLIMDKLKYLGNTQTIQKIVNDMIIGLGIEVSDDQPTKVRQQFIDQLNAAIKYAKQEGNPINLQPQEMRMGRQAYPDNEDLQHLAQAIAIIVNDMVKSKLCTTTVSRAEASSRKSNKL